MGWRQGINGNPLQVAKGQRRGRSVVPTVRKDDRPKRRVGGLAAIVEAEFSAVVGGIPKGDGQRAAPGRIPLPGVLSPRNENPIIGLNPSRNRGGVGVGG